MHETKKLRKVVPVEMLGETERISLWDNSELVRIKKRAAGKRNDEDTWAGLLGEPKESSKLIYDNGTWCLQGDTASLRDTRESIKIAGLPDTRVARFPKPPEKK
ncbi:MAG: hypothetical protein GY854_20825 [Deltaproteobacteria bacterium]|nr:hypothetical protein [Deltaproteobacteria bacterium]